MRVRVTTPTEVVEKVKERLHSCADSVETDELGPTTWETVREFLSIMIQLSYPL